MSNFLFTGDCPVEEGEALVYNMEIPIEAFFPTIEILGRFKLSSSSLFSSSSSSSLSLFSRPPSRFLEGLNHPPHINHEK